MAAKKLCTLVKNGFHKDHRAEFKDLLRDSKYMCKKCGRAAAKSKCLCKSIKL